MSASVTIRGIGGHDRWNRQNASGVIHRSLEPRLSLPFRDLLLWPQKLHVLQGRRPRKVPGRKGMTWVEEDGVDEEETTHRGPDE